MGVIVENLDKEDILIVKKALRICMYMFDRKYEKHNNADDRILARKFEKVVLKVKIPSD
tara:strand:+ start:2170 stop:2346 length:177 start_codon:yes stop_codon:yes gene_type:complete